jgi:hypothetical protein
VLVVVAYSSLPRAGHVFPIREHVALPASWEHVDRPGSLEASFLGGDLASKDDLNNPGNLNSVPLFVCFDSLGLEHKKAQSPTSPSFLSEITTWPSRNLNPLPLKTR